MIKFDTWAVTSEDIGKAQKLDPARIAATLKGSQNSQVWGLGDKSSGEVVCFLYVDQSGNPVVIHPDSPALTSR